MTVQRYEIESYRFVGRCAHRKAVRLQDRRFLLLSSDDPDLSPLVMEKQAGWVEQKTGLRCLFLLDSLQPHTRRRLIERKLPFVVPGKQLNLPDLALDLREQFRSARPPVTQLMPASQVLVLAACLGRLRKDDAMSASQLAARFGYTRMTPTRAFEELRAVGLLERESDQRGAPRHFTVQGSALWEKARPYLRSPVRKRVYLEDGYGGPANFMAGERALAEQSALGFGERSAWAINGEEWKQLQQGAHLRILPEVLKKSSHTEFEIWHYAPRLLAEPPFVDPLSLILSLSAEAVADERVQKAVEHLLGKVEWSQG